MKTRSPLYEASTQFKNWRYSPQSLGKVRASLNAAAVAVIRNTFEADEVDSFLPHNSRFLTIIARILFRCLFFDTR
jgi:hypothetical protein